MGRTLSFVKQLKQEKLMNSTGNEVLHGTAKEAGSSIYSRIKKWLKPRRRAEVEQDVQEEKFIPDGAQMKEIVPIKDTPFTAVKFDDKWILCMGKYKISKVLGSYEACVEDSKDVTWNRLLMVIKIVADDCIEETKQ